MRFYFMIFIILMNVCCWYSWGIWINVEDSFFIEHCIWLLHREIWLGAILLLDWIVNYGNNLICTCIIDYPLIVHLMDIYYTISLKWLMYLILWWWLRYICLYVLWLWLFKFLNSIYLIMWYYYVLHDS